MDSNRNTKWLEDINFLRSELPKKHKNLFAQKNKNEFLSDISLLKKNVDYLSNHEIKLQIAKIIASIGDAHTSVPLQINLLLPLELYWFPDGIYVISAPLVYKEILYCKITKVNGTPIEDVITVLKSIVSYENVAYLNSQIPKYLPAIEILYDLELVNDIDSLDLTFEDEKGTIGCLEITPLSIKESRETLHSIDNYLVSAEKLPLYRRNSDKYYWFQYISIHKIIYFKYNACRDMLHKDVFSFCKNLMLFIKEHDVEILVIDMRNNFGGNSTLLDPFIEDIKHCHKINKKGNLFVIVGRETFSSALLTVFSLKENTSAIFLGEPTGGKPNCYGEVQRFTLKNYGLTVCYSTEYYKIIEDDTLPSFYPDVNIILTIQDYFTNGDPCFEHIINYKDL
ncbi:MAG: S41 family peptidase [Clostridium sp.]